MKSLGSAEADRSRQPTDIVVRGCTKGLVRCHLADCRHHWLWRLDRKGRATATLGRTSNTILGGMLSTVRCRLCRSDITETFVDLGMSPLCESYLPAARLDGAETFYPLHVRICSNCLLVQLSAYVSGEDIFSDYAYFSSYSTSWVAHAKRYADMMTERLGLGPDSLVAEVASNDGYLLQHFVAAGIPVVGVEPAATRREVAGGQGICTKV